MSLPTNEIIWSLWFGVTLGLILIVGAFLGLGYLLAWIGFTLGVLPAVSLKCAVACGAAGGLMVQLFRAARGRK